MKRYKLVVYVDTPGETEAFAYLDALKKEMETLNEGGGHLGTTAEVDWFGAVKTEIAESPS